MWHIIIVMIGLAAPANNGLPMALGAINNTLGSYETRLECDTRLATMMTDLLARKEIVAKGIGNVPPDMLLMKGHCVKQPITKKDMSY